MNKKDVKYLIKHGTLVPHPKWSKKQVLSFSKEMYYQVEALRAYIIDNALDREEEKK